MSAYLPQHLFSSVFFSSSFKFILLFHQLNFIHVLLFLRDIKFGDVYSHPHWMSTLTTSLPPHQRLPLLFVYFFLPSILQRPPPPIQSLTFCVRLSPHRAHPIPPRPPFFILVHPAQLLRVSSWNSDLREGVHASNFCSGRGNRTLKIFSNARRTRAWLPSLASSWNSLSLHGEYSTYFLFRPLAFNSIRFYPGPRCGTVDKVFSKDSKSCLYG